MQRISDHDFIIHHQTWLMARSLRAVLRQDPAVIKCTAHKITPDSWRLHIEAADPLLCLKNALENIKHAILTNGLLFENKHNALPSA
jgi:hypothetical protein